MQSAIISAPGPEAVKSALQSLAFQPTVALVFASITHSPESVAQIFAQAGMQVFGATSAGEIAVDRGASTIAERSITALVLDPPRSSFATQLLPANGRSSIELGRVAGEWGAATFLSPALLVVASGLTTDGEQLVQGILETAGPDVPLFGGLAGDDIRFKQTWVFDAQGATDGGALVLAFDSTRVAVSGVATSGWTAVGPDMTVTSATGNIVHTIDGQPALDIYKEYLGLTNDSDILIPEYPLQLDRGGHTVMRAALLPEPATRSLIYAGTVPQGATVRFSCASGIEIIDLALEQVRQFRNQSGPADALVLFSCKGRHMALGPLAEDEVAPIQALWSAPLAGFYTYGEIGRGPEGQCDFHNETCVVVALKERSTETNGSGNRQVHA